MSGLDTLKKIGSAEIADVGTGQPKSPTIIKSVKVVGVHAGEDPYPTVTPEEQSRIDTAAAAVHSATLPTTIPTTAPATSPAGVP